MRNTRVKLLLVHALALGDFFQVHRFSLSLKSRQHFSVLKLEWRRKNHYYLPLNCYTLEILRINFAATTNILQFVLRDQVFPYSSFNALYIYAVILKSFSLKISSFEDRIWFLPFSINATQNRF